MISRRKEIFFVALCVVFSALFTIGCSDRLLHPAQDGARILVQLENSSLRSGDAPPPTEKWQGSAWIENRDGSESHHQDISSETDELSITFENVVVGSEIRIHLDVTSSSETAKRYRGSSSWQKIIDDVNVIVIVLKEVGVQEGDEPGQENPPSQETPTDADVPVIPEMSSVETPDGQERLDATASVADGGDLTYQWYSNTSLSNEGGTEIEGATKAVYTATVPAGETRYFYCVVKNTNKAATGNKTATATSNVVAVTNSSTSGTTIPDAGVVSGELGSQTNPVTTWADLVEAITGDTPLQSPIYISGTMEATETIMVTNAAVALISVGSTTITRNSKLLDELFWSEQSLTFIGSADAPIIFDGNSINSINSIKANASMISAEADLTMTHCTMKNNENTSNSGGGAILVKSGTLTLNNCQFIGNKTTGESSPGGAIYMTPPGGDQNTNKLIATGTLFESNATGGKYSNGGAISFENTTEINILNDCSFISNSASDTGRGGGIYVSTGAKVVLNGISMSGNAIASSATSQTQPTQEDIYMNNAPHLTLAGQLTIPTISWNRGDDSYKQVFTSGYDSVGFKETSSIGLTISGTIPTGGLQVFVDNTFLTPGQMNCISVTAEGYQCSWAEDENGNGYGRVNFVSN